MKAKTHNKTMKKKCKNVNMLDYHTHINAIKDVVYRHYKRHEFKRLLFHYGLNENDYYLYCLTKDKSLLDDVIIEIAKDTTKHILNRDLNLKPIKIRRRLDNTTGKIRDIGKETAMQQVYDYIAYHSAKEIFDKRIVLEQSSSIKGRGQIYGINLIKRWIKKDNDSLRYAKIHKRHYSRKCKY